MAIELKIAITVIAIPVMLLAMKVSRSYQPGTWQRFISLGGAQYLFHPDGTPRRGYRLFVLLWLAFWLALLWLIPGVA